VCSFPFFSLGGRRGGRGDQRRTRVVQLIARVAHVVVNVQSRNPASAAWTAPVCSVQWRLYTLALALLVENRVHPAVGAVCLKRGHDHAVAILAVVENRVHPAVWTIRLECRNGWDFGIRALLARISIVVNYVCAVCRRAEEEMGVVGVEGVCRALRGRGDVDEDRHFVHE